MSEGNVEAPEKELDALYKEVEEPGSILVENFEDEVVPPQLDL